MFRNMMNDLMEWQETVPETFFLLKGAKSVGKTWMIRDFATACYQSFEVLSLNKNTRLASLFVERAEAQEVEQEIQRLTKRELSYETLLIFDDLHCSPLSLPGICKYFLECGKRPIVAIASWVGIMPFEKKIEEFITVRTLMPMSFEEFLIANKAQEVCRYIEKQKVEVLPDHIKYKVLEYLNHFYLVGGMPEAVLSFVQNRDYKKVDKILEKLIHKEREYIWDSAPRVLRKKVMEIWESIPNQLTKENRKFMYHYVNPKARAREYESAVAWLVDSGLVRKVKRVKAGVSPLLEQVDEKSFELFQLDHGLLRVWNRVSSEIYKLDNAMYDKLSGVLVEQMVLAELTLNSNVQELYFWISGATAKIDFVFEDEEEIIPVVVQANVRTKSQNLKVFHKKYDNRMAIRISLESLNFKKGILNIPLYGLWNF